MTHKGAGIVACIALALCLFGCASVAKIEFADSARPEAPTRVYASALDAILSLDFAAVEGMGPSEEELLLAKALEAIVAGDTGAATAGLTRALAASTDKDFRAIVWDMLARTYLQERRWADLLSTAKAMGIEDSKEEAYARAYIDLPAERVEFPATAQSLPLTITPFGLPFVEVRVNGHPYKFLLDTGAEMTVISSDVAAACGLKALGSGKGSGEVKEITTAPTVIKEFGIGDIRFYNHTAVILKKEDLEIKWLGFITVLKIDGCLGWPAIMRMRMTLDCPGSKVLFDKPIPGQGGTRNIFSVGHPMIFVESSGISRAPFMFDTGASGTVISEAYLSEVKNAEVVDKHGQTKAGVGGSTVVDTKEVSSMSFVVGTARISLGKVSTSDLGRNSKLRLGGMLGIDALGSALLIVDYENGFFRFELAKP